MTDPIVSALGDAALTLTFGDRISEELSRTVVSRARGISMAGIIGVTDVVPSYASLTVFYDPTIIGYDDIQRHVLAVVRKNSEPDVDIVSSHRKVKRIPVLYDGPDLSEVAKRTGLSTEEVIALHSGTEYRVFVTGFVPGFAYLGILDERLVLPRRDEPRKRVPQGSVAIAERQTGVYPAATPGGWHILGTTTTTMFDPNREQPALLQVGDVVRFERAS